MKKDTKKWVCKTIDTPLWNFSVDGDLKKLIDTLVGFREKWEEKGWRNLYLEVNHDYEYGTEYTLKGECIETDNEFQQRIKKRNTNRAYTKLRRKKQKAEREISDRQLYEKLKKKFKEK